MRRFAPDLEFRALEGAGHVPMRELPDLVKPLPEASLVKCGVLRK